MTEDERALLSDTPLLTMKPVIYVANIAENDIGTGLTHNLRYMKLKRVRRQRSTPASSQSAPRSEAEIANERR